MKAEHTLIQKSSQNLYLTHYSTEYDSMQDRFPEVSGIRQGAGPGIPAVVRPGCGLVCFGPALGLSCTRFRGVDLYRCNDRSSIAGFGMGMPIPYRS